MLQNNMRSFILYIDLYKDADLKVSRALAAYLLPRKLKVLIDAKETAAIDDIVRRLQAAFPIWQSAIESVSHYAARFAATDRDYQQFKKNCYAYIAVGGDGTFIACTHKALQYDLPVVGMRLGHLGFLAVLTEENYQQQLERIIAGDYIINNCLLLACAFYPDAAAYKAGKTAKEYLIFNDIALNRLNGKRIARINLHIDAVMVDTIPADGIVICTPSGSTAYALSAGGAVIDSTCDVMEISPICPHTMHNRSYIVQASSTVHLDFPADQFDDICLSIDGKYLGEISKNSHLLIKKAAQKAQILRFKENGAFVNLTEKLNGR